MQRMASPDRVVDEAGHENLPLIEPVYPLTEGLSLYQLRKAIDGALAKLPELPEWQDPAFVKRSKFPTWSEALRTLHRPDAPDDLLPESPPWSPLPHHPPLASHPPLP